MDLAQTSETISWTALEYEEKERTPDWFWALGIAVIASAAAALIYGNYFFGALIILAGLLLGFYAIKKPDLIEYELGPKGVRLGSRLYQYGNIRSFWVKKEGRPTLFIKTERQFMPVISVPLEDVSPLAVEEIMLSKNLPEEEMREH